MRGWQRVGIAGLVMGLTAWSSAAVLVDDKLNDGSATNGTNVTETDVRWLTTGNVGVSVGAFNTSGNTGSSLVVDNTHNGISGTFPIVNGDQWSSNAVLDLSTSQKITLSFDMRFTATTPVAADGGGVTRQSNAAFRLGLGTSNSTHTFNFGLGTTTGASFVAYSSTSPSGGTLTGSPGSTLESGSDTAFALNDNLPHTFTFSITKTGASSMLYAATIDNKKWSAVQASGVSNFTFSRIVFGGGNVANVDFNVDNVQVVTGAVPEPASVTALGLLGLALTRRQRRR